MSAQRVAAIGERECVYGLAFAGVDAVAADDSAAVQAAWRGLPYDVGMVILTPAARAALELSEAEERLWVVIPE
jgi:vacuolar-type H+-ATPase subunit F/Vma7